MKAAIFSQYGDTEATQLTSSHPEPQVADQQVLVAVQAVGLNRIDAIIRAGYLHQMFPVSMPAVLGGDFSGTVRAVGAQVTGVQVGDEVYGQAGLLMGGSGSLAELAAAPAAKLARKPATLSMAEAAAFPLAGSSAIQALEEHLQLQPNQKVLIHGGAGGIGSIAIQLAKHLGAQVVTTVAGEDRDFVRSLGADEVIDYKTQDFTTRAKEFDAVLVTAPEALAGSYGVLKAGGVLVALAGQVDAEQAQRHEVTAVQQMSQASSEQLNRLAELVDNGAIKPRIDRAFPFAEVKEAFSYFEQQHPKGKVVVTL